jgi:cytochrome c
MQSANLTWNEATLNRFLENPREVVPGTTMAYAGLKNPQQRQAVIDYLKGL